jgi:DNA ligase-1
MFYKELVGYYEKLESISSKLSKTSILAEALSKTPAELLPKVVLLFQGRVFPSYTQLELGIATQMMIKAISKATGFSTAAVEEIFKKNGDLGITAEECLKKRKQVSLFKKKLEVSYVFDGLKKLATLAGEGSQEKKLNLIGGLITFAEPREAVYLVRTILGELRVGAAEGIMRDAIVKAFLPAKGEEEKEKSTEAVEYAWNVLSDFGEVAKIAKESGTKGLRKVKIEFGRPFQVMLGEKVESIEEVVEKYGKIVAEYKYDGMRTLVQKKGKDVLLFTRRQEDVTEQFPDVIKLARSCLKPEECVVEGETLAIDPRTDKPLPFQTLSQRIHRKYDISDMVKEIPVQVNLFDVLSLEGKMLVEKPFKERRKILEKIVKAVPGKFQLTKMVISDNVEDLKKFYEEALEAKQEGLMLKVLDSPYVFGRHVGTMFKIKPIMETLELVVVGATWGEGARARWLSSYVLACRDPDTGEFLTCGMMGTGLTEEQFQLMTDMLKPLIVEEKGREVRVKPKVVVEVGYQEIQKSPNYTSRMALRFPKLIRLREDRSPEECDTIERVRALFKSQGIAG